jgi:hypothetical protein
MLPLRQGDYCYHPSMCIAHGGVALGIRQVDTSSLVYFLVTCAILVVCFVLFIVLEQLPITRWARFPVSLDSTWCCIQEKQHSELMNE